MTEKSIRDNVQKQLNVIINDVTLSASIEKGIYTYCNEAGDLVGMDTNFNNITYKMMYVQKSRSVIHNLNPKSYLKNKRLLERVKNKKIKAERLAYLKHYELFPKKWEKLIEQQKILDKKLADMKPATTTDQFFCTKCKQRKCTFQQVQTRSADESMTSFITCLNCGYNWRE